MRRWRHRGLADEVWAALALEPGEHVLAHATDSAGRPVVATDLGLHLEIRPGGFRRLGWELITQVTWDQDISTLHVREADGAPRSVPLAEPGALPETVRERVTSTILVSEHVRLVGTRGVRLVARRTPRSGTVLWQMLFDRGLNPADTGLRAQAHAALEQVRQQTGV